MRKTLLLLLWTLLVAFAAYWANVLLDWGLYYFAPHIWVRIGASAFLQYLPVTFAEIALIRWLVWRTEGRSLSAAGWSRRHWQSSLALGLLIGIAAYLCTIGVIWIGGTARYSWIAHNAWSNALMAATFALLPALGEETVFRGYLFTRLEAQRGTWPALALSSVAFGVMHLLYSHPILAFQSGHGKQYLIYAAWVILTRGLGGVLFGAIYLVRRRFWMAVGCHWGWDWLAYMPGGYVVTPISRVEYAHRALGWFGIANWADPAVTIAFIIFLLFAANRAGQIRIGPSGSDPEEPSDLSPRAVLPPRTAQPVTVEGRTMTIRIGPQPYLSELLRGLGYWAVILIFAFVMTSTSPHDLPFVLAFASIPFAVFVLISLSSLLGTCTIRLDKKDGCGV